MAGATHPPRAEPAPQQAPPPHAQEPLPPQNLAAEEHVLCAMMTSPAAIDAVRHHVNASDFYRESHRHTYRTIIDLHDLGTPVDPLTVANELAANGHLKGQFTADHLKEIASLLLPAANAPHHAKIVEKLARFRDLIQFSDTVNRLGWEAGDWDQSFAAASDNFAALQERTAAATLDVETWHRFEAQAHDQIPVLVEGLWPEAAFGFIAAPPKKGKTWVALALAIAVATGKPLFGHYHVPRPRPVLYVALEGHRAALRARVGALARGMGIDPDTNQLQHLHFIYKPRGINLADPTWANRLRRSAQQIDAALTIVDVLRAGARIKENAQEDFTNLRHNLQPINDDGRSLALLHHNVKLSEISKERDPGERMSGSGAMFGALDAAIYITGSDNHARRLRLEYDTRDLATPNATSIELQGEGTGDNGGYTYRDTASWTIAEEPVPEEDFKKATPQEIRDYIEATGGDVAATEIRAYFEISPETLTRRLGRLHELGVTYHPSRGRHPAKLILTPPEETTDEQLDIPAPTSAQPQPSRAEVDPYAEVEPHNQAVFVSTSATSAQTPSGGSENGVSREKATSATSAPYGSAPTRARARGATRLTEAENWIDQTGWLEPNPADAIITRYPNLTPHDIQTLINRAQARAGL